MPFDKNVKKGFESTLRGKKLVLKIFYKKIEITFAEKVQSWNARLRKKIGLFDFRQNYFSTPRHPC